MNEDFKEHVIDTIKQMNVVSGEFFPVTVFVEPRMRPKTIIAYVLVDIFKDWNYDLSKFFSNIMNSKNLALVEEDFVHIYLPTAKPKLNITFLSGKKKEMYSILIIEKQGKRVLGKARFENE